MILKLNKSICKGALSFGGLQIYMILKPKECARLLFGTFGGLQIYMVLKHIFLF